LTFVSLFITAHAFVSSPAILRSKQASFLQLKQRDQGRIRRSANHAATKCSTSWIDTAVAGKQENLIQPVAEGGIPWDRQAWLDGWRSGEEVDCNADFIIVQMVEQQACKCKTIFASGSRMPQSYGGRIHRGIMARRILD
jgi:allantoicase